MSRLGALALAVAVLTAGSPEVPAQTQDALEELRNLTPAQQSEILRQLGTQPAQSSVPAEAAPTAIDKPAAVPQGTDDVPRLRAGDTVLLSIQLPDEPDRASLEYRDRVLALNPYALDRMGRLRLPQLGPLALAGLTADEAGIRLNAEPGLRGLRFGVRLLPVEPELKPFGYDLFSQVPTTFAPATDIPVPSEYVVGPGDTLEVQLIGDRGGRYSLAVGRDGAVDFPEIGPIAVAGMKFADVRTMLERRVADQLIGMRASISMGALRSIQVFVLGEAERPGSYTVSGLSTIVNALLSSGGVNAIGSLRNIELKRNGQTVGRLDLYDLLLHGDTSSDSRLMPGDVIFIPPVAVTAAISGEVQRPAIYEVRAGATAADLLYLAGGLTPEADPRMATIERIDERHNRTVIDVDLAAPAGRTTRILAGDRIRIHAIRDSMEGTVALEGHVYRAGRVQYRPGMRLTDLVGSLDEVRPLADLHYVLVRRETGPERRVSVVSADLAAAFARPDSPDNIVLAGRDRIHVFDLASSRDRIVEPILRDLERQSGHDEPRQVVGIGGRVKIPGRYPLEAGMTVSDLLRAGGSLDQAAFGGTAELTRYATDGGTRRQTEIVEIELARVLSGDTAADLPLRAFDYLVIREIPEWGEQETVTIEGEVRFPGTYPVRRGESLQSLLQRAGGLTDLAFADGAVFTREELRRREQRQMELLAERLQRELASLSLQQAQSADNEDAGAAMAAGRALLADLQATQAVGRLVIRLDQALAAPPGSDGDVILRHQDRLFVPRRTQEVTVIGEVQNPTSHLYQAGMTRDDYVARSGGMTQRADKRRVFVIRANGEVAPAGGAGWFRRTGDLEIRPGDTVIVPYDATQLRPLTAWTSVTQILYNIAVAVAAVNSF